MMLSSSRRRLDGSLRLALFLVVVIASSNASASTAYIEPDACPGLAQSISAAQMRCGWLITGDTLQQEPVRLRVVVLQNRPNALDPHPVVYVPGGPGDSAGLDARALLGWRSWQQRVGWPHDIVLFDPRGTGESRPRPSCTAIRRDRSKAAAQALAAGVESENEAAAGAECVRVLGANTVQQLGPNAQLRDLNRLLDALNVDSVHLWAVSYGTRIARLFYQRHPARVQSLILDSLVGSGQSDGLAMPAQVGAAIDQLDAACASDAIVCDEMPSSQILRLLRRYRHTPPSVIAIDGEGSEHAFAITPYRLLFLILFSSYDHANAADTLARLERADMDDAQALAPLAGRLWQRSMNDARSEAMFWSTRCAFESERIGPQTWQQALAAYPSWARYLPHSPPMRACDSWPVEDIEPPPLSAQLIAPTLVLAGTFDALTPDAQAARFASAHPQARLLRVADAAHAVTFTNICAQRAVAAFLADPHGFAPADCGA